MKVEEIVLKDAITKSGRKVKRPAHLDSPERAVSASPSETRKSIAPRAIKAAEAYTGTPGKRTGVKEPTSPEEIRPSRKTISSTRKAMLEPSDTAKRDGTKEQKENTTADDEDAGVSKSGRKIKVPARLMEFESEILTSPRKTHVSERDEASRVKLTKTPRRAKTPAKPALSTIAVDDDAKKQMTPKTPGRRGKSAAADQPEEEKKSAVLAARTPRRKTATALFENENEVATRSESAVTELQTHLKPGKRVAQSLIGGLAVKTCRAGSPAAEKAPLKTPSRRKKLVVVERDEEGVSETESKDNIKAVQTPGRRVGRSMINAAAKLSRDEGVISDQPTPKTPGRRVGKTTINAALNVEDTDVEQASVKTPGRRKRAAAVDGVDVLQEEAKRVTKTPGRRLDKNDQLLSQEQTTDTEATDTGVQKPESATQTDTVANTHGSEEPLSRSGRKIKQKRVFGFELDEKAPEPATVTEGKSLNDGRRKRKVNSVDETSIETIISPTKQKKIGSVIVQTPKQSSDLGGGGESSQFETISDGAVSRSGRKIKPKKMFGFDDGESESFVHITGSSPTLIEETSDAGAMEHTVQKDIPSSVKANTVRTPSKRVASLVKPVRKPSTILMEIDTPVEEQIQNNVITRLGLDDHHSTASLKPVIIRTSIGFGKLTSAKKPPFIESATSKDVSKSNVKPTRNNTVEEGSSRSGRKIISKKFFNADDLLTSAPQSTNAQVEEQLPVLVSEGEGEGKEQATDSVQTENTEDGNVSAGKEKVGDFIVTKEKEEANDGIVTVEKEDAEYAAVDVDMEATEGINVSAKVIVDQSTHRVTSNTSSEPEKEKLPPATDEEQQQVGNDKEQDDKSHDMESVCISNIGEVNVESKAQIQEHEIIAQEEKRECNAESLMPIEQGELRNQLTNTKPEIPQAQPNRQEEQILNQTDDILGSDDTSTVVLDAQRSKSTAEQHIENFELVEASLDPQNKETLVNDNTFDKKKDSAIDDEMNASSEGSAGIERNVDESVPIKTSAIVPITVGKSDSNQVTEEVPTESKISTVATSDGELLENASFGGIEYLEDEVNNIVEHIKKPAPTHDAIDSLILDESVDPLSKSSIVNIPETPAVNAMNETFSPAKPSSGVVQVIDITADTPRTMVAPASAGAAAATPRTPESKSAVKTVMDNCSPDKPPEIIEIMDSPAVAAFCNKINNVPVQGAEGGSATSTPLVVRPLMEQAQGNDEASEVNLQQEGRKRSLSASAADTTIRRNVTFHSPANCTMLVEMIDERLILKSLQDQQQERFEPNESSHSKSIGEKLRKPRKRSLSEHKTSELKRNKNSKLPNFKDIHAKHFNRMESIADFMKRKETRAKHILSTASPATKLLARSGTATYDTNTAEAPLADKKEKPSSSKPFLFKSTGSGGIPVPSTRLFVSGTRGAPSSVVTATGSAGRSALSAIPTTSTAKKPLANDTEKTSNRLKQFQATFKPKRIGTDATITSAGAATSTGAVEARPIDQLRSKQTKILKGVRTNRRFDLQMKHRDHLQQQ
uniref:Uncharacterized protein n=1 Tax=Anopheles christyi TaxID=43041 RepID=A0A182JWL6_9DIPT